MYQIETPPHHLPYSSAPASTASATMSTASASASPASATVCSTRNFTHNIRCRIELLSSYLAELIWPTRCACCEKMGTLLCAACQSALPFIDRSLACERCGTPFGRLICTECSPVYEARDWAFTQAMCVLEFQELSKRLITNYKDKGEQRLAQVLAHLLWQAMPRDWCAWVDVLTWIPADEDAVRRRGFDHMALLAVRLAQLGGLKIAPLLSKRAQEDQRMLGREKRKLNANQIFSVKKGEDTSRLAHKQNIILLDDVFTTGATLQAATKALLEAGAKEVHVVTVCRVW